MTATLSRTPGRKATPLHCKLPAVPAAAKIATPRRRTAKVALKPTAGTYGHLILTETKGDVTTTTNFLILVVEGGYRLTKFASDRRDDGDDVYDVRLGRDGTCGCKGCSRWGHCRHLEALAALVAAGKL